MQFGSVHICHPNRWTFVSVMAMPVTHSEEMIIDAGFINTNNNYSHC